MTTIFAVCGSTGISALQINTALNHLWGIKESHQTQIMLIFVMTLIAGASAHMGINKGVRLLSIVGFGVMTTMMMMGLLVDDTTFILNLFVQSLGSYMQHLLDLGFQTDAFEQLGAYMWVWVWMCVYGYGQRCA